MKVIVKVLMLRRGSGAGNHVWSDVTDDNCMSGHCGHSASHNTGHRQQHSDLWSADGQTRVENVARTRREVARVLEGRGKMKKGPWRCKWGRLFF